MKKKIIFCVTNDLSHDQRMHRICTSLSNAGFDICLVGRKLSLSKPLVKKNYQQLRLNCFFTKGKFFYIEYNIRLLFYLIFQKTDAICAIDLDTILPVFAVTKLRSKICVYDAHEYFTEVPEVIRRPLIKKIWEKIAILTIPKIQNCYTVGEALSKEMSNRYKVDFKVIKNVSSKKEYNKIETDEVIENFDFETNNKIIIYQGALNEGRGIEFAIDCMEYLMGYELWLAGEGDLSQHLRDYTYQKGLNDKVKFLGMIMPNELKKITKKALLGIHLTENLGLSYYFSLANRTFDYIHAGIPAIHPNFPEYSSIIEKYVIGEVLESYQPESIAKQIYAIIEDKEKYKKYQNNCIKAAEEFCWENEEIVLIQFYKQLFKFDV